MARTVSLRTYVALRVAFVTALPMALVAVLLWLYLYPVQNASMSAGQSVLAASIASQVRTHLLGGERQLRSVGDLITSRRIHEDRQVTGILDASCGDGGFFEAIFLVSARDGIVRNVGLAERGRGHREDLVGMDISGQSFFQACAAGGQGALWSKIFLSTISSQLAVAVIFPLEDEFLIGEITLEDFSQFISAIPSNGAQRIMVLDERGRVIGDSTRLNYGLHMGDKLAALTLGTPGSASELTLGGNRMLGSLVPIQPFGWFVLVAQLYDQVHAPLKTCIALVTICGVFALMFGLLLSWRLAGGLGQLAGEYAQRAGSIAQGRYNLDWPTSAFTEYRDLGLSLQSMAGTIRERERELVANEVRLQHLTANVPGVVYQFRAIRKQRIVNEFLGGRIQGIFGLDPQSSTFVEDFIQCLPDEDRESYVRIVQEVVQQELPNHYEGRFIRPDGRLIWFEDNAMPVRDGEDVLFFGFLTDITERRRIEESLWLTQFSFDHASMGIYHIAADSRILAANYRAAEMLGYTREEMASLRVTDIDHDMSLAEWLEFWDQLRDDVSPSRYFEKMHVRKDGHEIPVEIYSNFLEYRGSNYVIAFVQDISRRKQMEEALRNSEERFRMLAESALTGIYMIHDGRFIYVNQAMADMFGYASEELLHGVRISELVYPDDRALVHNNIRRRNIGDIDCLRYAFRGLRKGGAVIHVEVFGRGIEFEGRQVVFGTLLDITERKAAEQALRDNERLLNNILESMNEGVLVLDRDFTYTMFNSTMEKMTCTQRMAVLGRHPWDVFPFIRNSLVEENMRKAMQGEVTGSPEVLMEHDGRTTWTQDSFSPIRNADGSLVGIVGVVSDISQRKAHEKELQRLRNYLSNIINSMPSMLVAVDSAGLVTQWNNRSEMETGLSFEAVQAKPLAEVLPRLTDEMTRILASIRERRVIHTPKVLLQTDEETRYEDITIFPLVANGVEGAVIRLDDVTERVRMEEMMVQSEKMLTVGGLAAGMAHEINNPLAGMVQTATVMRNRLGERLDIPANRRAAEEAGTTMEAIAGFMEARGIPRMLETITSSGQRIADVVENMLSFARKEDKAMQPHDLERVIDKTLELAATDYDLKKQYDFKRIQIVREYEANMPSVNCQISKLQQVLLNILTNGVHAMQEAQVEAPQFIVRTYVDVERAMACIEIEDNGPGMDAKTCKHVFDPFFTTKKQGVGTGLGMSVSYFIITEHHGGELSVDSRPGEGAKFVIRLPLAAVPLAHVCQC